MTRIQHLLCCTDLTPASEPAWAEARLLARLLGADIRLLHVVPLLVIPAEVYVPPSVYDDWVDTADREAQDRLARLRDSEADPTTKVLTRVETGPAAEGILREARSSETDLIVMGTHGRTGLPLVALGSVADRIVRLAPCPVVTVRARPGAPAGAPERLRRLCYATDFSAGAAAAWPWVVTLAEAAGAEVDLVHVVPALTGARAYPSPDIGRIAQALREHAESQTERLRQASGLPTERFHVDIASGWPADEIIRVAEARAADLLVMGTHGWSGLRRWMLGSVAHHVIQAAPCPVLTVGPGALPEEEAVDAA
jgi:nucleotide-binding universal stress UspA family protein